MKRRPVENESVPIVDIMSPKLPARSPLMTEPPEMTTMANRPIIASIAYSGGAKLEAKLARMGAQKTRTIPPIKPPMAELVIAIPIASDALPFCANG